MDFNRYTDPIVNSLAILFSFLALLGIVTAGLLMSLGVWKLIELLN